jgi:acyl-CoA oxidase
MTDEHAGGDAWPEHHPELLPFLPMVMAVWNDGVLTREELDALNEQIGRSGLLDASARDALGDWLDPETPPSAGALASLRRRIRSAHLPDPDAAASSLTELGVALWQAGGGTGPWDDPEAVHALRDAERALHVLGAESARHMLGVSAERDIETARELEAAPAPHIDTSGLRDYLDRNYRGVRDDVLRLLLRPELDLPTGLSYQEHRERVLTAVRAIADEGLGSLAFPVEHGGAGDPGASVAVFETLAYGDLSVLVKFGVQFGLFGGSVHQLGTERHHVAYLKRIGTLDLPGCYAMTETGHGSNVRDLETTATYEAASRSLVINTPNETAGKDWIGNAALHGQIATVFARLIVGSEDHGVHAVLVPIRDSDGSVRSGVRIEDRGLKLGLNGVDNGRIWFTDVQVPVDSLLDRFASIDDQGVYRSPIASSGRRFFTMLRTLVAGRVSIASASVSAARLGLTIAIRYASQRRQFGANDVPETPILEYLAVQRALLLPLAATYAGHFAVRDLQHRFAEGSPTDDGEVEVLAAALKAWASDQCVVTLQACREMCGGQGYLAENRLAALKADTDIFTTFEGANLVLYQLAAKGLLSRYRDEMGSLDLRGALRYLSERAETSLTELNPVVTRRTDESHLMDPDFHSAALMYREDRLLRSVATRLRARLRDDMESLQAVNEVQDHLVALARAHAERVSLEHFQAGVAHAPEDVRSVLGPLCALFGLSRIEADRAWFLEAGYLEAAKSRAVRARINTLCVRIAPCATDLVDGFGIPELLLPGVVRRASG